ncbi:MAG: YHS domain-containing protein [Desulfuromonadaceae bacterium]|nr:YHS domain-containing protein [Desulfuromonadaceae bacterium]MDD5105495.1 YHS domain-containing protein [Desulfuromonadaceae bacterium]
MFRLLFIGLLFYIGYRIVVSLTSAKKPDVTHNNNQGESEETHRDPVCGVYVSEEAAVIGRYNGQRHYFCSMNCLDKYREQLDHSSPS